MRLKLIVCIFLFFALYIIFDNLIYLKVSAHPADQIFLNINVDSENPKEAKSSFYMSWQQLGYVLDKYGNLPKDKKQPVSDDSSVDKIFELYKEYNSVFTKYISNNLSLKSDGNNCNLEFLENKDIDKEAIIAGKGYKFDLNIKCLNKISKSLYIKNNLYVPEYPYQTMYVELTLKDKNYKTTFNKDSTEGEIINNKQKVVSGSKNGFFNFNFQPIQNLNLESLFFNSLKSNSLLMFFILFLIGALHTLEAGHSKAIILSIASNKDSNFKEGFSYVVVFTITHIADILLLALIFIFINSTVDIYRHLPIITKFSLYTLLLFSLYMLYVGIKSFKSRNKHLDPLIPKHTDFLNRHMDTPGEFTHSHGGRAHSHNFPTKNMSFKKQLFVGFLAGLAPCFMGWSIFLVILTSKQVFIIIPLILSFALGIAFTLSIFLFITLKFKKPLYSKFNLIGDISPIISALILLIYAVISLIKVNG